MTTPQLIAFEMLWGVLLVEGALLFMLYRHIGVVTQRNRKGLPLGRHAPAFSGQNELGETVKLPELLNSDLNLLVFGSSTCSGCHILLEDEHLRAFISMQSLASYFLHSDSIRQKRASFHENISIFKAVIVSRKVFDDYQVTDNPYAYLLSKNGIVVARGFVADPRQLIELCKQARPKTQAALDIAGAGTAFADL